MIDKIFKGFEPYISSYTLNGNNLTIEFNTEDKDIRRHSLWGINTNAFLNDFKDLKISAV